MDIECDEREDGEIVDEFDAISDYSIQSSGSGKSDSSQQILRTISLSSISEYEDGMYLQDKHHHSTSVCRKKRKRKRGKNSSQRRIRRGPSYVYHDDRCIDVDRYDSSSYSTDNDDKLDIRTLRQLREAVRINRSQSKYNNSLRSRLKGMLHISDNNVSPNEDEDIETLRTLALLTQFDSNKSLRTENAENNDVNNEQQKNQSDEVSLDDKELAVLRSEALKSAVLKKHLERKKKRENALNDKENEVDNTNNIEGCNKIIPQEIKDRPTLEHSSSIEEDIDIMRAMLLASMSTKIASVPVKTVSVPSKPTPTIKQPLEIKLPEVKPLIINLNDTDSDSELDKNHESDPEVPQAIDASITEFLKHQRELFEAKQKFQAHSNLNGELISKPLVLAPNEMIRDSASGNDNIEKNIDKNVIQNLADKNLKINFNKHIDKKMGTPTLPRDKETTKVDTNNDKFVIVNQHFVTDLPNVTNTPKNVLNSSEPDLLLNKSAVKLLSESQQQEYQLLKQKLLMASKKRRIRRLSQKLMLKANNNNNHHCHQKTEVSTNAKGKITIEDLRINPPSELKKTLQDLQVSKNGRLQMKGKYKALSPILTKVNEASIKRKVCEGNIKVLLSQLQMARSEHALAHEKFSLLVKQLVQAKQNIDTGHRQKFTKINTAQPNATQQQQQQHVKQFTKQTTSTTKEVSSVEGPIKLSNAEETKLNGNVTNLKFIENDATTKNIKQIDELVEIFGQEQLNEKNSDTNLVGEIHRTDLMHKNELTDNVAKLTDYVSPLDNRSSKPTNPFKPMCPYELFGVCKDKECKFNHCT